MEVCDQIPKTSHPQWSKRSLDLLHSDWVGPRTNTDIVAKRNISVLARKGTLVVQPISYLLNTE